MRHHGNDAIQQLRRARRADRSVQGPAFPDGLLAGQEGQGSDRLHLWAERRRGSIGLGPSGGAVERQRAEAPGNSVQERSVLARGPAALGAAAERRGEEGPGAHLRRICEGSRRQVQEQ